MTEGSQELIPETRGSILEETIRMTIRMTEERDKWRKYVHCVASPRIEDS